MQLALRVGEDAACVESTPVRTAKHKAATKVLAALLLVETACSMCIIT